MGKVVYSMGVSLDGFIAGPRGEIRLGDVCGGEPLGARARASASAAPPLDERVDLKLVETRAFGSGAVYLRYSVR